MTYVPTNDTAGAVAAAKAADVAIVCTGTDSSEGSDRKNLSLPWADDQLISAVAAAQPNTVVVVASPGAVLMPWSDSVKAILLTYMAGQEAGNAIADVLFGDVNPSGRTPLTMPMKCVGRWAVAARVGDSTLTHGALCCVPVCRAGRTRLA